MNDVYMQLRIFFRCDPYLSVDIIPFIFFLVLGRVFSNTARDYL